MDEKLKYYLIELGNRIRNRRTELNMSQEELALKCGYKSRSTINKIELGINDIPQSKIKVIADALHTTPGYIMGWSELTNEVSLVELVGTQKDIKDFYAEQKTYVQEKSLQKYEIEKEQKAKKLYDKYESAPPEIRAAIDTLLKTIE